MIMPSFLVKSRTKQTFFSKIKTKAKGTQKIYDCALNNFEQFCLEFFDGRNSDDIVKEVLVLKGDDQEQSIYDLLQSWVNWNVECDRKRATVVSYFSRVHTYLHYRGIKLTDKDIRENIDFPKRVKEELHGLTIDEIQRILENANPRKKGLYLALLSSGMRIGEALQVRKRDIDLSQKRPLIRIEAENTKTSSTRTVLISKEAVRFLIRRLEDLNDDNLVWGTHENPQFAETNEIQVFHSACDKAGLNKKYSSNGRRQISLHSFRAYFFTKIARKDENYAHKMMGHGGYLPQYDRMNDEEKLDLYLQFEPLLLVYSQVIEKDVKEEVANLRIMVNELAKRLDVKS